MANTKTTQEYVEVLSSGDVDTRTTQEYVEALSSAADPQSRVSQEYVEVLSFGTDVQERVTQEYVEVLSEAGDPHSRVTQEYLEVLSSALVAGTILKNYRRSGTLGCGSWTVQIGRRSGSPIEVEVPASSVRMGRIEDDISTASVSFANSDIPDWCVGALADLRPWVYELSLLRDGEQAWVGPISDRITLKRSATDVDARDLFTWMERRLLPFRRQFTNADLCSIFEQYVLDALARDSSPNITLDVTLSGILGSRLVDASQRKRAADALRDLAQVGVDFTMIGRTLRVRGRGQGDVLPNPLLDAHVLDEPQANLDGLQAASEWVVTSSDDAVFGSAGGVGIDTGLVTQVLSDSDITSSLDATTAATELLAASGAEPLQITCDLNPDAPFDFNDLVPGNFIDTRLSFGHFAVNELTMLSGVSVDAAAGREKVSLTLVRPSASPLRAG